MAREEVKSIGFTFLNQKGQVIEKKTTRVAKGTTLPTGPKAAANYLQKFMSQNKTLVPKQAASALCTWNKNGLLVGTTTVQ